MANGLVVADTSISVGGRSVLGANLGRVQVGMVTHTSDTALATQAAGGSQMGSAGSMTVPAAGVIRVSIVEMEFDETEGGEARLAIGLKTGSDAIKWATYDTLSGAAQFGPSISISSSVASLTMVTGRAYSSNGSVTAYSPMTESFDIVGQSLTAGSGVDVEVWLGDNVNSATGEATITGTTKTARFMVEIIDGS